MYPEPRYQIVCATLQVGGLLNSAFYFGMVISRWHPTEVLYSRGQCESQRLGNRQCGNMDVICRTERFNRFKRWITAICKPTFLIIYHLTPVMLRHFFGLYTGVEDATRNVSEPPSLVGDSFEECCTSRTRTAKNKAHFAWFQYARRSVNSSSASLFKV
jgi:hypothetical protein